MPATSFSILNSGRWARNTLQAEKHDRVKLDTSFGQIPIDTLSKQPKKVQSNSCFAQKTAVAPIKRQSKLVIVAVHKRSTLNALKLLAHQSTSVARAIGVLLI